MSRTPPTPAVARRGRRWPRATLRTYLVAIILVATLPLALLTSFRIVADGKLQREVLTSNLRSAARIVAGAIDRELTASRDALAGLAQSDTLQRGDLDAFERGLRARGPLRPPWSRLAVLDADGRLRVDVDGASPGDARPLPRAEAAALADAWAAQPAGALLASVAQTASAPPATWIGLPATTPGGARHLLAARVDRQVWQSLMDRAVPAADGYVALLVDRRFELLAGTPAARWSAGPPQPLGTPAASAADPAGAPQSELLVGVRSYVGWQVLDGSGWRVGVGVPAASFDAAQTSAVLWTVGVAATCLLLGVTLSMAVARQVTLPMRWLVDRAGADGAEDERIAVAEIAELRDAFDRSRRARDELMASEQVARRDAESASHAKDQLLSMLGHELRNPLNAIVTSIEVLRAAPPGSAMADNARGVVARQTRKLTRMVDDLLDAGQTMAAEVTLVRQPVELRALLARSVEAALPRAGGRSQQLHLDAPAPVWIAADPRRIEQVMSHLLENAVKHTPAGGTVTVRLAVLDGESGGGGEGKGEASVCVDDSGPGIDPDLLRRVFEPFVQGERGLDRATGGLGIGLALVKRLVSLHGGSVQASSSATGSSFGWRLPAIAPPGPSDARGAPASSAARRIGLVDDNPDALASMRSMLELAGHRVETAVDGPAAVAMLLADRPDLALVDIGLPGFDGYEVARRCRAGGYHGRLIAISGYGQAHDLARSVAEGFDAYLVKPLDPERLLPLLHAA